MRQLSRLSIIISCHITLTKRENMTADFQNTLNAFRNYYIALDRTKNSKDFQAELPRFIDSFIQDSLLYEIFCLIRKDFQQQYASLTKLNEQAWQDIREKYTVAKKICNKNGINIPSYRDDFPPLDNFKDHKEYTKIECLRNMNEFEAYEKGYLKLSNPLPYFHNYLERTILNNLSAKNINLPTILTNNSAAFLAFNLEQENLHDSVWNSLLWLVQYNPYGSLLSEEISPFLKSIDALEEIFNQNVIIPQNFTLDKESRIHTKKVYDHVLTQLSNLQKVSGNKSSLSSAHTSPIQTSFPHKDKYHDKKIVPVAARLLKDNLTLSTDSKEDLSFKQINNKGKPSAQYRLGKILIEYPLGLSRSQIREKLDMPLKRIYAAHRGFNKRLNDAWQFDNYIFTQGKKLKINDAYPTEFHPK